MRTSIWNEGPYKGFAAQPRSSAEVVHRPGGGGEAAADRRGRRGYGNDPAHWGDWVADIERPAEQYRGRYQLQLGTARGLLGDNP